MTKETKTAIPSWKSKAPLPPCKKDFAKSICCIQSCSLNVTFWPAALKRESQSWQHLLYNRKDSKRTEHYQLHRLCMRQWHREVEFNCSNKLDFVIFLCYLRFKTDKQTNTQIELHRCLKKLSMWSVHQKNSLSTLNAWPNSRNIIHVALQGNLNSDFHWVSTCIKILFVCFLIFLVTIKNVHRLSFCDVFVEWWQRDRYNIRKQLFLWQNQEESQLSNQS